MPPGNEILIEYDAETWNYFAVLEPMPAMDMGETENEALEDLKKAVCFGIETMINSRQVEIGYCKGDTNVKQSGTKRERNLGKRKGT